MTQHHKHLVSRSDCPVDQLEWFVNHTLPVEEQAKVHAHLVGCAFCQAEVQNWMELRQALQTVSVHTPAPRADLFLQIEQQLDLPHQLAPWLHLPRLLQACGLALLVCAEHFRAQARLIRRELFWMPLVIVPLISLTVYLPPWQHSPGTAALLTALCTAFGMAFLYGREVDPAREMTLVTPTSPRLVLGVRCCLVFGYNLLLNCGLVLPFLAVQGIVTPAWFLANWLAPLCCLSAIALLLSILVNTSTALVVCILLWGLRLLPGVQTFLMGGPQPFWPTPGLQQYEHFWHQGPLLFALAILTMVLAFLLLERKERFSG
ncbi:anti-sigma factor family protein [Dictyobacter arantiisoli]|uniref:Zinc-finger domain-containing protein n=1 Tax=Dictyobacter arantiisoli TaxID=2014874 RepID=A0A5A5TC71_9CHLR|nr:hypothetical protein [Dictyobacter arantiisoli]GCF09032.1 hypothetical protein KDI_25960 [Dictyobacter arantiisoli]